VGAGALLNPWNPCVTCCCCKPLRSATLLLMLLYPTVNFPLHTNRAASLARAPPAR
jgi:hypothetical protein